MSLNCWKNAWTARNIDLISVHDVTERALSPLTPSAAVSMMYYCYIATSTEHRHTEDDYGGTDREFIFNKLQ